MRTLIAPTEDFIKGERDTLTADVIAGTDVVLNVDSSANYAVDKYIVVGTEGNDTAEICQISEIPSNSSVKVRTLLLPHKKGETIVAYRYNKRKFYGSLTATGSYSEIAGSPVLIRVNNPQGTLCEYVGVEGYVYFKSTYLNSTSADETAIGDAIAVYAEGESMRYTTLYAIRVQAGLTENPYIGDGRVEEKRKQAESEINSVLFRIYVLPLTEVPGIIKRICELLAAGYLDFEEYGPDGQGVKWLGEARALLKAIGNGTQTLLDSDNNELPRQTLTQGIMSYPDQVDNSGGPIQMFTTRQKF